MPRTWTRVTAAELRPGDEFASTRNDEPSRVASIDAIGTSARFITLDGGYRIRPRHTTKFWRVVR